MTVIFKSLLICSVFFATNTYAVNQSKTLNVAVVLRLNDKFNNSVGAMVSGVEAAKTLFEEKHPRLKVNLKRYSHDEALESVVSASDKVIADKMPAVIGGELSEESIVLGDRLGEKKIIFITPTSSNPKVTENKPYSFRACFSDDLVASQLANFMVDHLKPSAVGIVHNVSSPYTDFLSQKFLTTFNQRMEKFSSEKKIPIYDEKVLRDKTDFSEIIDSFIKNKVTHVAMLTHQDDFSRFALQATNKSFFPVYLGSDGWGANDSVYDKFVKESPVGDKFKAYRNSYWKEDLETPIVKEFRKIYIKQNGIAPNAWSAVAFDAAWVLLTAMNRAKDPNNTDDIKKEMESIKSLKLVTSEHFAFGPDHSPRKDLYIYQINKDGIHYEATLR